MAAQGAAARGGNADVAIVMVRATLQTLAKAGWGTGVVYLEA